MSKENKENEKKTKKDEIEVEELSLAQITKIPDLDDSIFNILDIAVSSLEKASKDIKTEEIIEKAKSQEKISKKKSVKESEESEEIEIPVPTPEELIVQYELIISIIFDFLNMILKKIEITPITKEEQKNIIDSVFKLFPMNIKKIATKFHISDSALNKIPKILRLLYELAKIVYKRVKEHTDKTKRDKKLGE